MKPRLTPLEELEKRLSRPRKKRPKMRVEGKSVFALQRLSSRPKKKPPPVRGKGK